VSPIELSVTVASKSLRRFGVACSEVSVLRERRVQQFLFACSAYAFFVGDDHTDARDDKALDNCAQQN
jgi:hypothetical protein